MYLKDYDDWKEQVTEYYANNPDFADCLDQIDAALSDFDNTVKDYRENEDVYKWFKRCISSMISYRTQKYCMTYPQGVPDVSSKYETFPELLSAFVIELPAPDSVFSKTTTTGTCDYPCTSSADGSTICLDTSVLDNVAKQIEDAPKSDLARIFDYLKNLEELDRSLYIFFTQTKPLEVKEIDVVKIALEAKLDEVIKFYKWYIPGFSEITGLGG